MQTVCEVRVSSVQTQMLAAVSIHAKPLLQLVQLNKFSIVLKLVSCATLCKNDYKHL